MFDRQVPLSRDAAYIPIAKARGLTPQAVKEHLSGGAHPASCSVRFPVECGSGVDRVLSSAQETEARPQSGGYRRRRLTVTHVKYYERYPIVLRNVHTDIFPIDMQSIRNVCHRIVGLHFFVLLFCYRIGLMPDTSRQNRPSGSAD